MPEEWAEVELPCSAAVPDFSRDQQWGPGGESPVCCTCSRAPQNKQKSTLLRSLFLFPRLLWHFCHFPRTLIISHCLLTPSISLSRGAGQHLAAGFAKSREEIAPHWNIVFSHTDVLGITIKFSSFCVPFECRSTRWRGDGEILTCRGFAI